MNSAELGTAFVTQGEQRLRGRDREPVRGRSRTIAATARRAEWLKSLAAELGPLMLPVTLDVRNRAAVTEVAGGLPPEFAEIDVLVTDTGLALGLNPAAGCSITTLSRSLPPGNGPSAGSNRCRQPVSQPPRLGRHISAKSSSALGWIPSGSCGTSLAIASGWDLSGLVSAAMPMMLGQLAQGAFHQLPQGGRVGELLGDQPGLPDPLAECLLPRPELTINQRG